MKLFPVLAAIVGLSADRGAGRAFRARRRDPSLIAIGWTGFAAICLIHLGLIAVMGIAWGALLPGTSIWVPIWGRLVRDAGSELLPLSQVGGYVLGARAITFAGVSGTSATASTIVDVTLELFGQLAYTALALWWLVYLRPGAEFAAPAAIGLAFAGLLASDFVVVQRRGFDLVDRFAGMLGRGWADKTAAGAAALQSALQRDLSLAGSGLGPALSSTSSVGSPVRSKRGSRFASPAPRSASGRCWSSRACFTLLVVSHLPFRVRSGCKKEPIFCSARLWG